MANEVINETEESKENESSAIDETNTAAETPVEENVVEAAADAPVSQAPEEAAAETPAEEPAVETAAAETPAPEAPEETAAEAPAAETAASKADEGEEQQSSTDIDFGAILEKFEQTKSFIIRASWSKAKSSAFRTEAFWLISGINPKAPCRLKNLLHPKAK